MSTAQHTRTAAAEGCHVNRSPFLTQGSSSRRARALARRRRRRHRALVGVALLVLAAALAILLGFVHPDTTHSSASGSTGRGAHAHHTTVAVVTRSPAGLPLGSPPLHLDLSGTDDPVQASFQHAAERRAAVRPEHRPCAVAAQPAAAPAHGEPHEADDRAAGGAHHAGERAGADHPRGDRHARLESRLAAARQARARGDAAVWAAAALRQRRRGGARPARVRQRERVRGRDELRSGAIWGWAARTTALLRATTTRATTPARRISPSWRTWTSTSRVSPRSWERRKRRCRSRSRAASCISPTTTRCSCTGIRAPRG